ncbi:deoxyribodipyrimidine photo-lyase [Dyadobacter jejuensis]|uniref:Deoxyribodipyrimidine photo-lyase n=1 Tax=Dyadobacter jejuensis TaxID=1082580 RepID=A0A316AS30_9BACT|nr:deoxyribodipyrimidine photo-lyase [Dyadobacter jejuensis]PWJ60231.1 deoxyribodipyrimidine photo-lyase [Dyadobacter jejuensis]
MNETHKPKIALFWHRRDLRFEDNAGLYHALKAKHPVLPLFIFDRNILDKLTDRQDKRVTFLYQAIERLKVTLRSKESDLLVRYGYPDRIWLQLLEEYDIQAVYTNHDYEAYSLERDEQVSAILGQFRIPFYTFKDHVIFEKREILSGQGTPYTVFTPYSKAWRAKCTEFYVQSYPIERYEDRLFKTSPTPLPTLTQMDFTASPYTFPNPDIANTTLQEYEEVRNYPAMDGTSLLGIHLRFGTISIRKLVRQAQESSLTFENELIWRDFYQQILANFPHVGEGKAFRPAYDLIQWRNNEDDFKRWCEGRTGYPLVDAGMHQLNETGFMHNRVRMVTASFLVKHLLIDWRWGEAYFAEKLLDYDFAANNGGWQWAAGSGTDAAPYFRIFNPTAQAQKFDSRGEYIKKWVPELNSLSYPAPMVDHKMARERCLRIYKEALDR